MFNVVPHELESISDGLFRLRWKLAEAAEELLDIRRQTQESTPLAQAADDLDRCGQALDTYAQSMYMLDQALKRAAEYYQKAERRAEDSAEGVAQPALRLGEMNLRELGDMMQSIRFI